MENLLGQSGLASWRSRLKGWKPKPNSGSLLKDVVFMLAIVFIQTTALPTVFGSVIVFDLVTPWLVVTAVRQKPLQGTIIALVGAFALETKMAVPAGIYLCSYWILVNILFQIRPALSWRYRVPWLASYTIAGLWIILFETFVLSFLHDSWSFSPAFLIRKSVKLVIGIAYGMMLAREWMRIDAEEPVPL